MLLQGFSGPQLRGPEPYVRHSSEGWNPPLLTCYGGDPSLRWDDNKKTYLAKRALIWRSASIQFSISVSGLKPLDSAM